MSRRKRQQARQRQQQRPDPRARQQLTRELERRWCPPTDSQPHYLHELGLRDHTTRPAHEHPLVELPGVIRRER